MAKKKKRIKYKNISILLVPIIILLVIIIGGIDKTSL